MFKGKMPDLTPATLLAVVGWVVAQFAAYGWLNDETKAVVLSAASSLVAVGVAIHDAWLRGKRNEALASGNAPPQ